MGQLRRKPSRPSRAQALSIRPSLILVALIGFGIALALALFARQAEYTRAQDDLDTLTAQQLAPALQEALNRRADELRAIGGLFRASQNVEPNEFRYFVHPQLDTDVAPAYFAWARSESDPAGDSVLTIQYAEPQGQRQPASERQILANPALLQATENSAATRQVIATDHPIQVAFFDAPPHFVITYAVPAPDADADPTSILGYAVAGMTYDALLRHVLSDTGIDGITVVIDDRMPNPTQTDNAIPMNGGLVPAVATVEALGRSWRLTANAAPAFIASRLTWQPWLLFLAAAALTASITLYVAAQQRAEDRAKHYAESQAAARAALEKEVAERTRAEEHLRASEEKYRTVIENIPGVTFRCLLDDHWTINYITKSVVELTGYHADDFLRENGRTLKHIVHPDDREYVTNAVQEAAAYGEPCRIEYRITNAHGDTVWVSQRGKIKDDELGRPLWLDAVIVDITQRRRYQEELVHAK